MPDYTSRGAGQAEKPAIATSCVCTRYPHYVLLTLNHVSLFALPRWSPVRPMPLAAPHAAPLAVAARRRRARPFTVDR